MIVTSIGGRNPGSGPGNVPVQLTGKQQAFCLAHARYQHDKITIWFQFKVGYEFGLGIPSTHVKTMGFSATLHICNRGAEFNAEKQCEVSGNLEPSFMDLPTLVHSLRYR